LLELLRVTEHANKAIMTTK